MAKNIVILGAGFGGLKTAFSVSRELKRLRLLDKYKILLIDRNKHHTFVPLLYEVATTAQGTANIIRLHDLVAHHIISLTKDYPVNFIQDEVVALLPHEGRVRLQGQGEIAAEYLVLALGSETNYFNIPGLKERSLSLKTFTDAIRLRDRLTDLALTPGPAISVVVGGGGATGVELSAELASWCHRMPKTFCRKLSITLIQGAPTILTGLDPRVVSTAEKRLARLGIAVKTNTKITGLTATEVEFENKTKLAYDVFVWSGGVKTPDLLFNLPLKTETRGMIETTPQMRCLPQTPDLELSCMIYGIGDSVCSYNPRTQKPVPAVAPAALAQASVAAHNVIEDIKEKEGLGQPTHRLYIPRDYPYIVPVGGKYVIAKFGPLIMVGILGWILKGLVELYYLASIMPTRRALKIWLQGLWVFVQNDQLG